MNEIITLSKSFHEDIQSFGELVLFEKDNIVYADTLNYVYFIISGKLKISEINFGTNKEQTLNILSKGDIHDIVTIMDSAPHEYSLTALEPSQAIKMPITIVRSWIDERKEFRDYFLRYVSNQIRSVEELALGLSLHTSLTRLIKLILDSADKNSRKYQWIKGLNHEEISAIIGSVRNVVNRDLQKLKKKGVIDIKRKAIELKDITMLEE